MFHISNTVGFPIFTSHHPKRGKWVWEWNRVNTSDGIFSGTESAAKVHCCAQNNQSWENFFFFNMKVMFFCQKIGTNKPWVFMGVSKIKNFPTLQWQRNSAPAAPSHLSNSSLEIFEKIKSRGEDVSEHLARVTIECLKDCAAHL